MIVTDWMVVVNQSAIGALFIKGGPMMYLLALCSVIGVYIVIYKALFLRFYRFNPDQLAEFVKSSLVARGVEATQKELRENRDMASKVLVCALKLLSLSREDIQEGLKETTAREVPKLDRYMSLLSTITTVAPLLGLLGTILGLIQIFNVISGGSLSNPSQLAGGIAEALITTVTGLLIAIPLIFCYQFLRQRIDFYLLSIEQAVNDVVNFSRLSRGIKP